MADLDALIHRVRPAAGEPQGAMVLLHGRGAHEDDLFPLFDILDPEARLVGVTPRAPLQLPPGGYHWYVSAGLGNPEPDSFLAGISILEDWLEGFLAEAKVPIEKTLLGGFSQGAVMSYAMSLGKRRPRPAGLMAFSGFIPAAPGFELDLESRKGFSAAIGHGTLDGVIGVEWSRAAKETLEAAGADLIYSETPMGHGIDPAFLQDLKPWLTKTLG